MKKRLVVGLDLGGTKIAAGVVDSRGALCSSVRIPTPCAGVQRDLAALFDATNAAIRAAGVTQKTIEAVGIGVPGAFDPRTQTVWAPNLPGWGKVPLGRLLERALRLPVFVEGDRNVQALAEVWQGGLGKVQDLILLTIGTGIGAGIIADGRLISGSRGVAGAAGWMAIESQWQKDFGRLGCLESLSAGPAIARLAEQALIENPRSSLRTLAQKLKSRITAETVVTAARRGDSIARRVLEQAGTNLGRGVAGIISLLNPEVVVVGGGLAGAGEFILAPLRRAVKRWGQPLASRHLRIVRSSLDEQAGILGAARYALLRLENEGTILSHS
jgi:glucokinase